MEQCISRRSHFCQGASSAHMGQGQVLDNAAAVAAINNCSLTLEESVHLLCCLAFLTAHHQCEVVACYIPGTILHAPPTGTTLTSIPLGTVHQASNH